MSELNALTRALAVLPADTPITAGMLVDKLEEAERAADGRSSSTEGAAPQKRCSRCRTTRADCRMSVRNNLGPCCPGCKERGEEITHG